MDFVLMHPALITDEDFARWLELVKGGMARTKAASAIGFSYAAIQKRVAETQAWLDALNEALDERAADLQHRLRTEVEERAFDRDDPKSWNALETMLRANVPEYQTKSTVETTVSGTLEMRTPEVVEALERFSASVVQAASRVRTGQTPGITVTAGNGGAGLPVGKLDGKTRPG